MVHRAALNGLMPGLWWTDSRKPKPHWDRPWGWIKPGKTRQNLQDSSATGEKGEVKDKRNSVQLYFVWRIISGMKITECMGRILSCVERRNGMIKCSRCRWIKT